MERDPLIQPSPSFQQLRLAGEHHEQPHKQLIRPPIARPVLAGERKKDVDQPRPGIESDVRADKPGAPLGTGVNPRDSFRGLYLAT